MNLWTQTLHPWTFFCHFLNALLLSCFSSLPSFLIAPAASPYGGCLFWKATVCVTAMTYRCAKPTGDKILPRCPPKASPCLWQLPQQSRALLPLRARPHRTLTWTGMGRARRSTPEEDSLLLTTFFLVALSCWKSSTCCTERASPAVRRMHWGCVCRILLAGQPQCFLHAWDTATGVPRA